METMRHDFQSLNDEDEGTVEVTVSIMLGGPSCAAEVNQGLSLSGRVSILIYNLLEKVFPLRAAGEEYDARLHLVNHVSHNWKSTGACNDKVQAMPVAVHVHCPRCVLLGQSLNADIFAAHVAGAVVPLASTISNLYA